jgi:acetoin utilization deacetylase AcuC-like enzyme
VQHQNAKSTKPFPILLASTHQFEVSSDDSDAFFPGTGNHIEDGHPFYDICINCPLPPQSGSKEWRSAVTKHILPRFTAFVPDLILISAGFDSHKDDVNGDLNLLDEVRY